MQYPYKALINRLKSTAIFLVSLVVVYAIAEVFFIRQIVMNLPITVKSAFIDKNLRVVAQKSKHSAIPENYTAIFGDSYAAGVGDWLLDALRQNIEEFNVTHIIHRETDQDIVDFGVGGTGTLYTYVISPASVLQNLERISSIEPPDTIWLYFYSANDLKDNYQRIMKAGIIDSCEDKLTSEDLDAYTTQAIADENSYSIYISLLKNAVMMVVDRFSGKSKINKENVERYLNSFAEAEAGTTNTAIINGAEVFLPDTMPGPHISTPECELQKGFEVFEYSLAKVIEMYPNADIKLFYIASPLMSYNMTSDQLAFQELQKYPKIQYKFRKKNTDLVSQKSEDIKRRFFEIAEKYPHVETIDTHPEILKASSKQVIHGPIDWRHFNREGYTVFADILMQSLPDNESQTSP